MYKIVSRKFNWNHNKAHSWTWLAKVDSHNFTPTVNKSIKQLNQYDFKPFKKKQSFFAMTAHVIYKSLDSNNTATHSKKVINLLETK